MQFFYHKDSGNEHIVLEPQDSHYLFVVRRFKEGSTLITANLTDLQLYTYRHERKNIFVLVEIHEAKPMPKAYVNILLAVIDQKDIYDTLPTLNALNVASLQLFYADFSQKNRKIDIKKAHKILRYSCMQCGRMLPLDIALHNDLESVCELFPQAIAIDFDISQSLLEKSIHNEYFNKLTRFENLSQKDRRKHGLQGVIIGCEGGFSPRERNLLYATHSVYALQIPYILTSHLTSTYIAGLCL